MAVFCGRQEQGMRTVKEQEIIAMAPNANAVSNARKISLGGGFVTRMRAGDDTFYMGECKGSGEMNYVVSADYTDEAQPVLRCTCPSRQFPCKHSLALLFEMAAGKEFPVGDIPQDILAKRQKKAAREAKKKDGGEDKAGAEKNRKTSRAAKARKIKKQLEGLELLRRLTMGLLNGGLASMGSVSLKNYRDLAKQLGDYYLPGPLIYLNRLILEIEAYQKDQDFDHYRAAVEILKKLHALEKKAVVYLNGKLENDNPEADDDQLYEELGGVWKLEQLIDLGLKKESARLLQLSFQVDYDQARKEFIDLAYWADLESGEICHTCNYRPIKALKYVKQEDSCFKIANIPVLAYYPGNLNRRVRWNGMTFEEPEKDVYRELMKKAYPNFDLAAKAVKNEIKNVLSEDFCPVLVSFDEIGMGAAGEEKVLAARDRAGNGIRLKKRPGWRDTESMLPLIPDGTFLADGAVFGLMYYDPHNRSMCLHPLSILKEQGMLRLLY